MADITLAPGAEEIDLAGMLAQMLEVSLERPEKEKVFNNLKARVFIFINDMDLGMTMDFDRGKLVVHGGKVGKSDISIVTDSETLLELIYINIIFGVPNFFDETGRGLVKKLIKGELKIKGMFTHVITLIKVTRVISLN